LSDEKQYKRIRERLELKIPVRVRCRETPDFEWVEITRVVNITPFGAGFTLKRPTERGRILHLTIPMPRQLRVFDHVEDQYRIWALVRYVRNISKNLKEPLFEVGVAFIGKKPPASYEQDPSKRFDISQAQAQSAQLTSEMVAPVTTSDQRAYTRHSIAVDLILEVLDEKNFVAQNEVTVTENLSKKGATIFTTMEIPVGRFVRIKCDQYQITCFAVVRSKSASKDGIPRIHVEFVDRHWPL
jgi:hypothetical protein